MDFQVLYEQVGKCWFHKWVVWADKINYSNRVRKTNRYIERMCSSSSEYKNWGNTL